MRIFNFLSKSSKLFGLGLFGLGIVSGLSGTLVVVISSRVIVLDPYSQVFYRDLFFIYTLLMVAYFIIQKIYQTILIKISQSVIWRVRLQVLDRIRNADFYRLQNYGSAELYTILTTDTENISFASSTLASAVTSVVTIFCCLGYLVWLTPLGFIVTLVLMSLVAITYWVRQQKIVKILRQVRDKEDEFFKYTQHLIHGIKEIKMDRSRSEDLYINYLNNTAIETEQLKVSASTAFMNNSLLGQLYFFITLGCFLFIFPYFGIHLLNNSSQYVIIILYLMTPAQNIAQLIPHLNYAEISINRLEKLAHKLSEDKQVAQANTPFTASGFESLTFDKASYTYGK